jgi:peptidoglycan L-alanyl-D-glutamate endopeptidase CwlK
MFSLSVRSRDRLKGLHPKLIAVVERAIKLSAIDFTVVEGVRTPERQRELYAQGRTKPGDIVTWTLNSRHFVSGDGFGHAVDVAPIINGEIPWKNESAFDAVATAMFRAAAEIGVSLRWGADWDRDGKPRERGETDSPHFEIVL